MQQSEVENLSHTIKKRFEIIKAIGSGAAANVYHAIDRENGNHEIALKVLRTNADYHIGDVKRFCDEYRTLCTIHHPNLIEAYSLIEEHGTLAYTMEYINGTNLLELVASEKLSQEKIVLIVAQILSALSVLHEKGIAHRDVKLENVLIREDGLVKLSDLGLLKPYVKTTCSTNALLLGTTHYFPPEYIMHGIYDAQSDMYALGLLLYECLIGKRWLDNKTGTEALYYVIEKNFTFPVMALHNLPAKFKRVLEIALALEPRHRYKSVLDMRKAILSDTGTTKEEVFIEIQDTGAFSQNFFAAQIMSDHLKNRRKRRLLLASSVGSIAAISTLVLLTIGSPKFSDPNTQIQEISSVRFWLGEMSDTKQKKVKISFNQTGDTFDLQPNILSSLPSDCLLKPLQINKAVVCGSQTIGLKQIDADTLEFSINEKINSKKNNLQVARLYKIN